MILIYGRIRGKSREKELPSQIDQLLMKRLAPLSSRSRATRKFRIKLDI